MSGARAPRPRAPWMGTRYAAAGGGAVPAGTVLAFRSRLSQRSLTCFVTLINTTHATVEVEPHHTFLERLLSTQYFTIYIVQAQLIFLYPSSFLYPLLLEQDVLIHDGVVLHEL